MNRTTVERLSDRELVITRTINGPARIVFEAWTRPELLKRWWAPCSLGVVLLECDADVRVGGRYRFVFGQDAKRSATFSGVYTEVAPHVRLVYTQILEAMPEAGEAIVTITFREDHGKTQLVLHELYPSRETLDSAIASGMDHGIRETMDQLEQLVASATVASETCERESALTNRTT